MAKELPRHYPGKVDFFLGLDALCATYCRHSVRARPIFLEVHFPVITNGGSISTHLETDSCVFPCNLLTDEFIKGSGSRMRIADVTVMKLSVVLDFLVDSLIYYSLIG